MLFKIVSTSQNIWVSFYCCIVFVGVSHHSVIGWYHRYQYVATNGRAPCVKLCQSSPQNGEGEDVSTKARSPSPTWSVGAGVMGWINSLHMTLQTESICYGLYGHYFARTSTLLSKCPSFNPVRRQCRLCLQEKYCIIFNPEGSTLNDRSEIFATCRHRQHLVLFLKSSLQLFTFNLVVKRSSM